MTFSTNLKKIIETLENINPDKYAATRNFIDGSVTYLSPYISRGVISLPQVKAQVLRTHTPYHAMKLLQELAWREYWQRVWQNTGNKIFTDLKHEQTAVAHRQMIAAVENAVTGITAIDKNIELLYNTGYMHNHFRMYVASITCNIGKAHWLQPSLWMYYHLLDGDLASNSLSWQWVAATFSSKKYYCNQENINKYSKSHQQNTFLDCSYEKLVTTEIPEVLRKKNNFIPQMELPETALPFVNRNLPTLVYNSYNLDPLWHAEKNVNRILLLEPSHFKKFPVSEKVLKFFIDLAKNINDIQIFVGEFDELAAMVKEGKLIFKSHPAFLHYHGTMEEYETLFPEVTDYYPSFSAYWKRCEKYL